MPFPQRLALFRWIHTRSFAMRSLKRKPIRPGGRWKKRDGDGKELHGSYPFPVRNRSLYAPNPRSDAPIVPPPQPPGVAWESP
jgi:hypothetical protein